MSEVVIVRKRDAKTDRPEDQNLAYPTDRGVGVIHPATDAWLDIALLRPFNPQPSVWYDLRPTEGEPLTVDDLEAAHDAAQMLTGSDFHKRDWPRMYRCQDRLRAALDALTKEADDG